MEMERAIRLFPNRPYVSDFNGERGRNRTFNLLIKSQLLCQLSYAPEEAGKPVLADERAPFFLYHNSPAWKCPDKPDQNGQRHQPT